MAFFLLINSVGYTIYAHYCDDELQNTSLMVKAESCCEDDAPSDNPIKTESKSCCAEKDIHVVIKDHFEKSEQSFSALSQPVLFLNALPQFSYNALELPNIGKHSISNEVDVSPPRDLTILHAVFRI